MAVGQDILLKGIELCQVGRKRHAGRLFVDLLRQEPNNEQAWWWLAACVDTEQQKRECFERLLNINPNHHDARAALRALSAGQPGRVDGTRSSATGGPQPRADLPAESPQNISEVPVSGPNVVEMLPRIRTAPLNAMYRWDAQYEEILDAAQTSEATQVFNS